MASSLKPTLVGVVAAIGITTAMDATGFAMFSALPLLGLVIILWLWERFSRAQMGLVWGRVRDYGLALIYPIAVLGTISIVTLLTGAVDTTGADWNKAGLNMAAMSTTGVLAVLLTEEGFFRGWLWASLKGTGQTDTQVLVWSSVAFSLWHLSPVSLDTGFDLPLAQIPVYMVNATVIGAIWGMLRLASGSVIVPSVCHAVWNGLDYPLFGFGTKVGALGITQTTCTGRRSASSVLV